MVAYLFSLALLALGVAAAPDVAARATTFVTSTSAYEATRPASVPGGGFSETFGFPPSATDYFAGGGVWATGGPAGGELAGTAAGGPNGPNTAAGHATGALGPGNGELSGEIGPTGAVGCGGAGYGSFGTTLCLSAREAKPTA